MTQKYKTLADYFEQTEEPYAPLAKQLGVSESYISLLVSGQRQPSLPVAVRIQELTGVPVSSLVTAERAS